MVPGMEILAAGLLAKGASTTTVQVSAAALFDIAEVAAKRGDEVAAIRAYEALISDVSQEVRLEARFRLALLEVKRGNLTQAAIHLRRIVDQRPDSGRARLELAGVLSKMGDKDGAWRQIRAVQALGLPPAVARLVDRYSEALRAQRSFGGSVQVSFAPDNNINHATDSTKLATVIGDFDIGNDSRAKSGVGIAIQAQAYRRFSLGGDRQVLVRLSGLGNLYKQKRFDDYAVDIGVGPELRLGRNQLNLEFGATQRWYAQKPYQRSVRFALSAARPVAHTSQVRVLGSVSSVNNQINDMEDGTDYSGRISFEHALSATTGLSLSLAAAREARREPAYATTNWRMELLGWQEIGRLTLTAAGQIGRLHADERFALLPERREERFTRVSLAATLRSFAVHGFAPVGRMIFERNKSTIAFYDYKRRRVELGFERAF